MNTVFPEESATVIRNYQRCNAERLKPIRDWLARGGEALHTARGNFDFIYSEWVAVRKPEFTSHRKAPGNCGRLCCIGGAAQMLYGNELLKLFKDNWASDKSIGAYLGLSNNVMRSLFYPGGNWTGSGIDPYDLPAPEIAKVLTHLMETDVLDWSIV
jgi:hypothetical protein